MTVPKTDRTQAQRQLELLGYKPNEAIYLRFFYASNDPRKENDRGRKLNHLDWKKIEHFQQQGRGVYFVINGGGHRNDDVKKCRAIFIEHDDLDKETQKQLWRSLNLPEPTFQVDTGGKSIHSYWVFDEPIPVPKWCELQRDLLKYAQADPSIKNPARVMRLAGGWHISHKEGQLEYNQSQLISDPGTKYSYETLRSMIPHQQKEATAEGSDAFLPDLKSGRVATINLTEALTPYSGLPKQQPLPHHPDLIQVPVSAPVPLLECCRKEVRDQVNFGVPKGSGRNDAAIAIGLELISVERYLQSINQPLSQSARQLFNEFCQRSDLSEKEEAERWNWCESKNPTPSCGENGISACIRGWYWNEVVKPQRNQAKGSGQQATFTPNGQTGMNQVKHFSDAAMSSPVNLVAEIRQIIRKSDSETLQAHALMTLAEQLGKPYRDVEALAKFIRRDINTAEETVSILAALQGNLQTFHQRLNLTRYLDPALANPLVKAAIAMPTAPEYIFNTLLPVAGSLIGTKCRIIVNPDGGYVQPSIFWTANVARSGQAKTPPQKIVIQPLEEMEAQAFEVYQNEMDDYLANDKEGAVPIRKRRILNNVTMAQKLRLHGENPNGCLEHNDEMSSDYNRMNQFRSKGDDLQQELALHNGGGLNFDRHDSHLFLPKTAISKTGTFQWETLGKLMEDDTNFVQSGYLPRFLLCSILDAPDRRLDLFADSHAVSEFQAVLRSLYASLENLSEQDYFLSYEAKQLFQAWNHHLIDQEKKETHGGLQLVYSKIEGYTARIALWLHLVNAVMRGERPAPVISGQTMQSAIEIAMFYLGQHKLVHAHNSPDRQLEGLFLKVQTQAKKLWEQTGAGVSASWLKSRLNALKKWGTDQIREKLLRPLAEQGFGRIDGEGPKMLYIPEEQNSPSPTDPQSSPINTNDNYSQNPPTSTIGEKLVTSPIAQSQSLPEALDLVGETAVQRQFGRTAVSQAHLRGNEDSSNQVFLADNTDEIKNVNLSAHNTNEIQGNLKGALSNGEETSPWVAPRLEAQESHPNTNQSDSILDEAMRKAVGDSTHSTINPFEITNNPKGALAPQVKWLLNFLLEVEKVTVAGSQFTCLEQILSLLNQVESIYQQCEQQVNQVCADYCERLWNAIATASQLLPEANG